MAFNTVREIAEAQAAGKGRIVSWEKVFAPIGVAGKYVDSFTFAGSPPAGSMLGTNLAPVPCYETTVGALYHGGNRAPLKKHVLNIDINSQGGILTGPAHFLLVDLLVYYPGFNLNTTAVQLTGSAIGANDLPIRDGVQHTGVNAFMIIENTVTTGSITGLGALAYTSSEGVAGRVPLPVLTAAAYPSVLMSSLITAAGLGFSPFVPMSSGNLGVRSVQSLALSTCMGSPVGGSQGLGRAAILICEPILGVPVLSSGVPAFRDFVYNCPSIPRIRDGACLAFLILPGAAIVAATPFIATMDIVWG